MITLGITWFFACFFSYIVIYIDSIEDKKISDTFNLRHNIDCENLTNRVITLCYFCISVLSSITEGDFIPLTNIERIVTIFYKLTSIIFYSYVINYFKV